VYLTVQQFVRKARLWRRMYHAVADAIREQKGLPVKTFGEAISF
jgi:hypothetical protein